MRVHSHQRTIAHSAILVRIGKNWNQMRTQASGSLTWLPDPAEGARVGPQYIKSEADPGASAQAGEVHENR